RSRPLCRGCQAWSSTVRASSISTSRSRPGRSSSASGFVPSTSTPGLPARAAAPTASSPTAATARAAGSTWASSGSEVEVHQRQAELDPAVPLVAARHHVELREIELERTAHDAELEGGVDPGVALQELH